MRRWRKKVKEGDGFVSEGGCVKGNGVVDEDYEDWVELDANEMAMYTGIYISPLLDIYLCETW